MFLLLKMQPSLKIGQLTLHLLHLKQPGFSDGLSLSTVWLLLKPVTSCFRFLDCLLTIWKLFAISLPSGVVRSFLPSLNHLWRGGFLLLYVKKIMAILCMPYETICFFSYDQTQGSDHQIGS